MKALGLDAHNAEGQRDSQGGLEIGDGSSPSVDLEDPASRQLGMALNEIGRSWRRVVPMPAQSGPTAQIPSVALPRVAKGGCGFEVTRNGPGRTMFEHHWKGLAVEHI